MDCWFWVQARLMTHDVGRRALTDGRLEVSSREFERASASEKYCIQFLEVFQFTIKSGQSSSWNISSFVGACMRLARTATTL
jgi:hypothetical protein